MATFRLRSLVSALALVTLLAACSGSSEVDETAEADSVEVFAEEAVADEGLVEKGVAESVEPSIDVPENAGGDEGTEQAGEDEDAPAQAEAEAAGEGDATED